MKLKKMSRKAYAHLCGGFASTAIAVCNIMPMLADDGTTEMKQFITTFVKPWLELIGGAVAMVGGVMFALGWQREDAEGKSKGLMTCMAGFMIVGIAAVVTTLFIK